MKTKTPPPKTVTVTVKVPDYKPAFCLAVIAFAVVSIVAIYHLKPTPPQPGTVSLYSLRIMIDDHEYYSYGGRGNLTHSEYCEKCRKTPTPK